jgi:RNA recognition motif-containing protein
MVVRQSEGILPLLGTWVSVIPGDMHNCSVLPREVLRLVAHTQEMRRSMEAKLYVGNLPFTVGDADLQSLFSQAGTVKSAQVIKDRASGRSKGFGFVEMSSPDEAQGAITMFHGKDFSGRALTVNLARPREERPGGGGFRSGGGRKPGSGGGERRRDY